QMRLGDRALGKAPKNDFEIMATKPNPKYNRWGTGLRWTGRALLVLDAAIAGYKTITAPPGRRLKTGVREFGRVGGAATGAWAFGTLGAAIGTAICPGLGTAIGGVVGGLIGALAGGQAADNYTDSLLGR